MQVTYDDGLPGDLTTAHPSILPDGSLLNFTRSLPFGGFHVYRQDPATLRRTQVGRLRPCAGRYREQHSSSSCQFGCTCAPPVCVDAVCQQRPPAVLAAACKKQLCL